MLTASDAMSGPPGSVQPGVASGFHAAIVKRECFRTLKQWMQYPKNIALQMALWGCKGNLTNWP
jgi:hypothetical protein